jgi:hypothetical protein
MNVAGASHFGDTIQVEIIMRELTELTELTSEQTRLVSGGVTIGLGSLGNLTIDVTTGGTGGTGGVGIVNLIGGVQGGAGGSVSRTLVVLNEGGGATQHRA